MCEKFIPLPRNVAIWVLYDANKGVSNKNLVWIKFLENYFEK